MCVIANWHLQFCLLLEIAKALRQNSTLRSLDLSWNGLGNKGGKALIKALEDNSNLSSLNLASNRIGEPGNFTTDLQ